MKISEILLNYDSDKNLGSIDPEKGHIYGKSYDSIFEKFDMDSNQIYLLEIGIQKGGSISAWKDYFKNGKIYGIDIQDQILDKYRRDDVEYIISDIKDPLLLEKFNNIKFDIIIDDGSHYLEDVICAVKNFSQSLKINGYMIIEDCQSPHHWFSIIQELLDDSFEISVDDMRNINNRYDDFLIIIKRTK